MNSNLPNCEAKFVGPNGTECSYYSLPELEKAGIGNVSRLPVSIRVVLESVLRNRDEKAVTAEHVRQLANWEPQGNRVAEIPFKVARVILQDFTGVPLLADLAAMRDAAVDNGANASVVEPLVPVDLVVDHSVQVDNYGSKEALRLNLEREFERNGERYRFLKWGMDAFKSFRVVPPGVGIVHQVNLEHLAKGIMEDPANPGWWYPDTLVGTDSHTTMINGVGVVGWGVGGIEAEAAMLGQPVYILTPDVIGVKLTGKLREGRTATDLVLTVTEMLRKAKVVGKFVEFLGEGAESLSVPDRATISNMAPEYGATMGYFPVDEKTLDYFATTGRDESDLERLRLYLEAQGLFGIPQEGQCDYTEELHLDLGTVVPSVAGPKRPQDRIPLTELSNRFDELLRADDVYGRNEEQITTRHKTDKDDIDIDIGDGDVLIAAITSCTNTSNPAVLVAAGLLARNAVAKGLKVHPRVKTSLAPGSRVVTDYLGKAELTADLEQLGFHTVGYGCTTCIGNSGPIDKAFDKVLQETGTVAASVLSGNRNFEARVHPSIRANFLMSPPLVVAFALAGSVKVDLENEPLGEGTDGPVYLRDIWPSDQDVHSAMKYAADPDNYRKRYTGYENEIPMWQEIEGGEGERYSWQEDSTYIRKPPFFSASEDGGVAISGARALAILGDSITTDHISPAGAIKEDSPAGSYLRSNGVNLFDFNSYGSRRGNHEVMMRGTFANVRIRNLMVPGTEGGLTVHHPSGERMSIYDASMRYQEEGTPLIILAGSEYGSGSSRDWAAKGTSLLGVRAVVATSFERIHRSNLVGMGVLPMEFSDNSAADLNLDGTETFAIEGIDATPKPRQSAKLVVTRADGSKAEANLVVRIDTPNEVEYFTAGGILPHVMHALTSAAA